MDAPPVIVWFRQDLRLADNPALRHAHESGAPVICLFVLHDSVLPGRAMGAATRWWLAGSLRAFAGSLRAIGGELVILRGDATTCVSEFVSACEASQIVWNRRYDSDGIAIDTNIKAQMTAAGISARSFNSHLLNEPWEITSKAGTPMKVYTPYWRAVRAHGEPASPLPAPAAMVPALLPPAAAAMATDIAGLGLEPTQPDWASGLRETWTPGEQGARDRLSAFLAHGLDGYDTGRNRPDLPKTSMLSPHLRSGEISVRQCWHAAIQATESGPSRASAADLETFLKELVWREFSYHLLHANPELAHSNYNTRFDLFPWRDSAENLKVWQRGQTGYPIVDAGMRQLWHTGWMHNRVRMIVGSFLVKHLLIDWRRGEEWFWDTLVDADPASNAASWQWVAGSGADAAPYFRVFNPVIQGEKFDPAGLYVKTWVPELAGLPPNAIHKPWTAAPMVLAAAGVRPGVTYPEPVVRHEDGRERALQAWRSLRAMDGDVVDT